MPYGVGFGLFISFVSLMYCYLTVLGLNKNRYHLYEGVDRYLHGIAGMLVGVLISIIFGIGVVIQFLF